MMNYSACWDWIQSLNTMVTSFKWSQPNEFLQNTLVCDAPRCFRREWNQRSRENTDFAIISTATRRGYQRWIHCHKHVLQSTARNIPSLGQDSSIHLDIDSEMVENLLRVLYIRQYVSVASVTDNHRLVLRFAQELHLVPDRMKAIKNYLRSEFHRFAFNDSFLRLSENELRAYLDVETLPLKTVSDINTVLRSLLAWAGQPRFRPSTQVNSSKLSKFSALISDVGQMLEKTHGDLRLSLANSSPYAKSFDRVPGRQSESEILESDDCDLILVCSDNVKVPCRSEDLCRVEYFNSMLRGGFRESSRRGHLLLGMPSLIVRAVLECLTTGAIAGLGPGRLLDLYTMFDYLQSDRLFEVLDNQFRKNLFTWLANSEAELLLNMSVTMMLRLLPFVFEDLVNSFGLRGYAFSLGFLLRWIERDFDRDELIVPILSNSLDALDGVERSKKVVYESFDGCVHVFDGKTWAPCYWGDFDSSREGIYNYQVTQYKRRYLTHNFLRSNAIALHESLPATEKIIVRHSEGVCGYFVEMFGRVFFSAGQQHFVLTGSFETRTVDLPIVGDFALEPRCFDEQSRRVFFDCEELGYWVELDASFEVIRQVEFSSVGVTADHQFCVLDGFVFALKLGHESFILDENKLAFCPISLYTEELLEPESPMDLGLVLPKIAGVIYKCFKIESKTFLIVTEAVELTQARLRVSETESDPKVIGFFQWCSTTHSWIDVLASSKIPRSQIQQTVVMNHPGVPLYARRPCHVQLVS